MQRRQRRSATRRSRRLQRRSMIRRPSSLQIREEGRILEIIEDIIYLSNDTAIKNIDSDIDSDIESILGDIEDIM
jgi:hypothetical protein